MRIEQIHRSLEYHLPVSKLTSVKRLVGDFANEVYVLETESLEGMDTYYFKIHSPTEEGKNRALSEVAAAQLIQKTSDIPVAPTVLVAEDGISEYGVLTRKVPGKAFSTIIEEGDEQAAQIVAEKSGLMLSTLHEITSPHFGSIFNSGKRFDSWQDCLSTLTQEKIEEGLKRKIINNTQADFFSRRLTDRGLQAAGPVMIHGDFVPSNIIVDPETLDIAGLIDLELSKFWIPQWDLTVIKQISFPDNPELIDIMFDVYFNSRNIDPSEQREIIEFYKPFESFFFWFWGWDRSEELREFIKHDIEGVTGV